jgi:hypothetical protein
MRGVPRVAALVLKNLTSPSSMATPGRRGTGASGDATPLYTGTGARGG